MRFSLKLTSLPLSTSALISLALIGLLLPLQACTHSSPNLSEESLEARSAAPSNGQPPQSAEEDTAAILEQMAPSAPEESGSAALEGGTGSDYIDPSQVGLAGAGTPFGEDSAGEARADIAPDLHQNPARSKQAKSKYTKKNRAKGGKRAKSQEAAILAQDGQDPAALQSESRSADPTSRVAEVGVMFTQGSSTLNKKYANRLKEVAKQLQGDRQLKVTLASKTAAQGNAKRERALAQKRAQAVKSILLKNGVKPSQIQIEPVELVANAQRDSSQGRMVEVFLQN